LEAKKMGNGNIKIEFTKAQSTILHNIINGKPWDFGCSRDTQYRGWKRSAKFLMDTGILAYIKPNSYKFYGFELTSAGWKRIKKCLE
jgi:hypothetical protein